MNVLDDIIATLREQGAMPFVDFMHRALYAACGGYYSTGSQVLGRDGDFITAPELTPLFGQTLAHQCAEVLSVLHEPLLFEFGAGSGQLCVDVLTHLESLQALPSAYVILDVSGGLEAQQRALITEKCPRFADRVTWLSRWPTTPFNGVVIANEVLDAMPVHRFLQTDQGLLESYISLNENDGLEEVFKPCVDPRLTAHIEASLPRTYYPYQSEANLFVDGWMRQCYAMLDKGALFLLDYGFPRHEYYHPDRYQGSLMCHYRHRAHTNPLIHVGEQDITAHVDFTHIAEAADAAGFHVAGYTNQASFLLSNGLLSLLEAITDEQERVRANQAVKQLLQPTEMGELFKVMALTKHLDTPLTGFQWQDKRASL